MVNIEDSPSGIQAAKAAEICTIVLKASRIRQVKYYADIECNTYDEVLKFLESEEKK